MYHTRPRKPYKYKDCVRVRFPLSALSKNPCRYRKKSVFTRVFDVYRCFIMTRNILSCDTFFVISITRNITRNFTKNPVTKPSPFTFILMLSDFAFYIGMRGAALPASLIFYKKPPIELFFCLTFHPMSGIIKPSKERRYEL